MSQQDRIDVDLLKKLMRMKPRLEDVAIILETSGRTIERFIREQFDQTFKEFRELHMVHTRNSLIQKAIDMALDDNAVMLIFCLKNLCAWQNDPGVLRADDEKERPVQLTSEQLKDLLASARGLKAVK